MSESDYDLAKAKHNLLYVLAQQGIAHPQVLKAIENVPREAFVPSIYRESAYENRPLPIGKEQTISQPYVVARMTELALGERQHCHRILEIGTGSGYQAAVLAQVCDDVYSIERIFDLYEKVCVVLSDEENIHILHDDGHRGWAEHAPYDAIIVTAGANEIPTALLEQLADNGRLVIPLEDIYNQQLTVVTRKGDSFDTEHYEPVIFVPMLPGKA